MIKTLIIVTLVSLTGCRSQSGEFSMKRTAGFAGGAFAAAMVHEGGHYIAAKSEGANNVRLGIPKTTCEYDKYDKSSERNIAGAGFIANAVATEAIMASDKFFPKDNSFVLGYLTWAIVEPLTYVARHELNWSIGSWGDHDLRVLDETGVDTRIVEGVLIGHALLTGYRLLNNSQFLNGPDLPLFIRPSSNGVLVSAKFQF